ncbi:kinesin-like protein KIN-7D, mitochondrial isoform X2 [Vigna unguiculata]|uniref:kinesin-like protein KIN-7D, mitochondrial isoform X2 n=1 Tax=Vigna unguiculata TaxID=3917 RepID=UPI0010169DFB|nr:kinesin-like protein KIN-7D, mitochondrial isoform X2 [Vigna unguiculata]
MPYILSPFSPSSSPTLSLSLFPCNSRRLRENETLTLCDNHISELQSRQTKKKKKKRGNRTKCSSLFLSIAISPFSHRKPSTPHSSSSSTSSVTNGRVMPRSCSSSTSSFYNSGGGGGPSMTPSRGRSDSISYGYGNPSPVEFGMEDEVIMEPVDPSRSRDSISVTIRFRPLSEREYHRGDEIAWYADGDKIVRNEYNLATAYAFDRVFGPHTNSDEVYEVAAKPVVKSAMDGVNGTVFAYGVTSSGKTHTMHGDQNCPGIIPLAIKDVFSIIQDTPGREFLLRVSYIEIYNEVINDLLDPTGQNLRVREDAQGTYVEGIKEEVVLSPGHALSFIAAGEEHRHVGSNNFNLFSSRSHTIFTLMIESSAHGEDYDGVVFSQLNLIDLAGSESSKTETTGLRRKEGSYINKSLLTLGTVIGKLSEGKASHVPYRDSKLTRLLQSSLSGHGHVSLICTVTPASSNMEETHNTLKFASRAKRVEIYASRNKIIDEKSLIKKYQREISILKHELDQLKKGMQLGVNHEEIMSLKQKLEEGQVKMQSRLEEEEEAKVALMSRIQKLTKLILVSSKNTIPGYVTEATSHHQSHSVGEDDGGMTMSDEMDLLVEQVKMLAGDIAFSTSTLKRLMEQSVNDPESSKIQIENLEQEIQAKRKQMSILEQRIIESGESSVANSSLIEMQQTITRLMTQCDEKAFELEIKSADNRVLQEQLDNKCSENRELQEKVKLLEQQLARVPSGTSLMLADQCTFGEHIDELKRKIQSQEIENEKLKLEQVQLSEENSGLHVQNQKLSEEASYAKELASAAAVELKNLAGEVTKLSLQNAKLEKELMAVRDQANARNSVVQTVNGVGRKYNDARSGRKGRISSRANENFGVGMDEFESWSLDANDLRMELQARRQREAALEAALSEKEFLEDEYRKKVEEAKKREASLENDLANMWVLVAKLKKEGTATPEANNATKKCDEDVQVDDLKTNDIESSIVPKEQVLDLSIQENAITNEDPLVVRLKARMQEMREKEFKHLGNGDTNSHVCKVCFESSTAAILLPCRHFCLCKSCSLACSECPICRTNIADRLFAFTS